MASNPYFNLFNNSSEQSLIMDLVTEALRIHAHDCIYLPKSGVSEDRIMNQYEYSEFNTAIDIEFYIKNVSSFEGEPQFLSNFGLEIRDQVRLTMAIRSFNEFIQPITGEQRPLEGDCIYIPMTGAMYQIMFVENSAIYFQLGDTQTLEITASLFESSGEVFNTGRTEVDAKYNRYNSDINEENVDQTVDTFARNSEFTDESEEIIDVTEINPIGNLF
jgi:hypothetical protein